MTGPAAPRYAAGALAVALALAGVAGCASSSTTTTSVTARADLEESLLEAAGRGDLGAVRAALAGGARVDTADPDGQTPLVRAAYGNHVEVAEVLVAAGADVNRKDRSEQSAYLIATSEVGDDPRLLELTLGHGADVRALDSWRGTGLIRAAHRGYPRIIERLLAAGCPVDHVNRLGWTALHEAIILGDGSARYLEVVRQLVAAGADVDLASGRDRVRPLTHARARGHTAIADLLVAAGAHE